MASGIPDPALVVLVGPAGVGKSTWAAQHYRAAEIVSSDDLRGILGSGRHDLDATADAFRLLDDIVAARTRRGLTCVIDTLGLEAERRRGYLALARAHGLATVAVRFSAPPALVRQRNATRDRPVPAPALTAQLRRTAEVTDELAAEGWDAVVEVAAEAPPQPLAAEAPAPTPTEPTGLDFVLQLSRFGGGDDPAGWLREIALAAETVGFAGLALMDHLIQIPTVGRAWDPIPEPWVTLGLLAGLDTRLRLGPLVSPVTYRPAGITAKTVATLDALSGGRAFLGIGTGWWEREHAAFGLPFPPPATRLDQLETAVETIRALLAPGTRAYTGERVQLPETTCYPRPTGPVPIIVGGAGARTLRIAARWGDACNVRSDEAVLAPALEAVRQHCAEFGRDPDDVAITVLDLPVVGPDREQVWAAVERHRGRAAAATFARTRHAGTYAEQRERYARLAERGVRTVFVAPTPLRTADDVLALAPMLVR